MGFFDLFRKKKEEVKEIEKISFSELDSWIENKKELYGKEYEGYLKLLGERKTSLVNDLDRGILGLKNINWEKIKVEDRIKKIVVENLNNYSFHLNKLRNDLETFEGDRERLDKLFSNFEKRAGMNYQKATFLIGKEIGVIDEAVANFFRDLKKIRGENEELIKNKRSIDSVNKKISEIIGIEKKVIGIKENIEENDNKIGRLLEDIKVLEVKKKEVWNSKEFKNWEKSNEEFSKNKQDLYLMISELKKIIDFKKLAGDWHKNENEMKIVKNFKDNFTDNLEMGRFDDLNKIIVMLDNKDLVLKKLNEVLKLKESIDNFDLEEDLTLDISGKIGKLRDEIRVLEMDKEKEKKRIEKFDIEKVKLRGEIGNDLEGVVEVGD